MRIDLLRTGVPIFFLALGSSALAQTGCGAADLCADFEPGETRFGAPDVHRITTTSLGTLVWEVENKADDAPGCSGFSAACAARIALASPGRDGGSAIRISTLDNDLGVASTTLERSEMSLRKQDTGAVAGQVQWWAHSVFIPADSVLGPGGVAVLQFHPGSPPSSCNNCGAPNFLLSVHMQRGHPVWRAFSAGTSAKNGGVDRVHQQYTYSTGGARGQTGQCLYGDFQKGAWYDFVHRIGWSYTDGGSHEIWMRKAGAPVKKVLSRTGINTLYEGGSAFLKIGAYHPPVPGNTSVLHDRIRRSSLSGAAGADAVRMADFPVDLNAAVTWCAGAGP